MSVFSNQMSEIDQNKEDLFDLKNVKVCPGNN